MLLLRWYNDKRVIGHTYAWHTANKRKENLELILAESGWRKNYVNIKKREKKNFKPIWQTSNLAVVEVKNKRSMLIMSQFYSSNHILVYSFSPHLISLAAAISIFTSYLIAYRGWIKVIREIFKAQRRRVLYGCMCRDISSSLGCVFTSAPRYKNGN